MTLDGKILQGLFKHERLKPVILRTSEGNVSNLVKLKQIINVGHELSSWNESGYLIYYPQIFC